MLCNAVRLTSGAIIEKLNPRMPIYTASSAYGHFGSHAAAQPWEQTDLVELLQAG